MFHAVVWKFFEVRNLARKKFWFAMSALRMSGKFSLFQHKYYFISFKNLVYCRLYVRTLQSERKILHFVISHIEEMDRRKIYLKRAYSSLFEYLTRKYGYSPASAQRRIEAASNLQVLCAQHNRQQAGYH